MNNSSENISYLTEHIIPYIGNKRRLLPLIKEALRQVLKDGFHGRKFLDLFAGSGVVSRFAKYLGFEVHANDWEYYSYILNYAFLYINRREHTDMFIPWHGTRGIISYLNGLPPPEPKDEYIARYFSPKNDEEPDYKTERLFYTRYNGLIIDKIRNEIESLYPKKSVDNDIDLFREKVLLLALLIYQAATHTNTSGVFKAFHKGFGGFSKDALSRILKPITLEYPELIDSDQKMHIYMEDANLLVKHINNGFDVVYIDPPYNQHQYGSNYHLLNTIALWDRIPLNEVILQNEKKLNRAGIRKDWVNTKSDYCYRDKALSVFKDLIGSVNAGYILISYSTEGTIPFQEMISVCSKKGKVSLVTNEYVKYRGGKQSINRKNNNIEFIIIIDTQKKGARTDLEKIDDVIIGRKINLQVKKSYSREKLERFFQIDNIKKFIGFQTDNHTLWIRTKEFLKIDEQNLDLTIDRLYLSKALKRRIKRELIELLIRCECKDKAEEIDEIIKIIKEKSVDDLYFISLIPDLLKKIAHKKYRALFNIYLQKIKSLQYRFPYLYSRIETKMKDVEEVAYKRFNG